MYRLLVIHLGAPRRPEQQHAAGRPRPEPRQRLRVPLRPLHRLLLTAENAVTTRNTKDSSAGWNTGLRKSRFVLVASPKINRSDLCDTLRCAHILHS